MHRVTIVPGDGVGPEVTEATMRVLEATGVGFEWYLQHAGASSLAREGTMLPDRVVDSIRDCGLALKGPLATPAGGGFRSANIELRARLGLHTGIRPCKAYRGVPTPFPKTDLTVVRMLAEDLYAGIEYDRDDGATVRLRSLIADTGRGDLADDVGISIKPISASSARAVARTAFEHAISAGRSRVTAVHKANVMRSTDGLFLETVGAVAREYPRVEVDDGLVDTVCHQMVRRPEELDVLVLPMLYGDIVSDLGAALIGGLGMAPGMNVGHGCAVFEAVHGSAPRRAGRNSANPLGLILSGVLLLRHVGEREAGERVERAVAALVEEREVLTSDITLAGRPSAGTSQVADALVARLDAG